MWTNLAFFIGAGLSASFALGALFMARQKANLWYWALFIGVIGMAVGGFGYVIPEAVPHGDGIFIFSVLFMMVGVFTSYQIQPIEPTYSEDAQMILTQKRIESLRLLGVGVSLTLILGGGLGYYLFNPIDRNTAKGLMSGIGMVLYNQQQQDRTMKDMRKEIETFKAKAHKDSLTYAKILANQAKGLANQEAVLKEQKQVKANLKKAEQRPVIIVAPAPKTSIQGSLFPLPDAVHPLPTSPRKGRKFGFDYEVGIEPSEWVGARNNY